MQTKKCAHCKLDKLTDEFHKATKHKDGLCSLCKKCKKISDKKYVEENKERLKIQSKIYRDNNVEKLKKTKKEYYENNLEILKAKGKIYRENNKDANSKTPRRFFARDTSTIHNRTIASHRT